MSNPFDEPSGMFVVLINDEGQYSLWPNFAAVPSGWQIVHGPDTREACLNHVEANWTDMRPKSLVESMSR